MPDTLKETAASQPHVAPPPVPARDSAKPRRSRHWSRHWPLPVSFVLAVIYWLYLNEQVAQSIEKPVPVHFVTPTGGPSAFALNVRTPGSNYTVTEIRDANNKLFDHTEQKVFFRFDAPGKYVRKVEGGTLQLIVDARVEQSSNLADEFTFKFTKADVKDASGELTPYVRAGEMIPRELTIHLKRSGSINLVLSSDYVLMKLPEEGDWGNRILRESLKFSPDFVTLTGPKSELDEIDAKQPEIFTMDLRDALEDLVGTAPDQRKPVAVDLRLKQAWLDKGIQAAQQPRASVLVAPEPQRFKGFVVNVAADWKSSPLAASEFKISETVPIQITSYNSELSRLLQDPKEASRWVTENVRCWVRPAEVESSLDHTKDDFVAHLEPYWLIYDRDFIYGKDLAILKTGLIAITRKSP